MQFSLEPIQSTYRIRSYGADFVQINEEIIKHSVIVQAEHLVSPWHIKSIDELTAESFLQVLNPLPEIILLGTGPTQLFPVAEIALILQQHHVGFEVMATGAACRTFNVLIAEDRSVACALIL